MESVKQLYQVFTNKLLFVEWILQVLRAVSIYFLKVKARIESDQYAVTNKNIDMRTAPPAVIQNMVYDEDVLKMRWDSCLSCEFLNDANMCQKCGCFMAVKHKLAQASCPIGKWGKYKKEEVHGITATS